MLETAPLLQKFLGVQPRAFGAVLVVLGLLQVALGVLFLIVQCCYTDGVGIHFFSGIPLFLAGVISVTADKVPSVGLVKACLIFHIISAATAAVINFLYVRDILYYLPTFCTITDKVQNACQVSAQFVFYCTGLRGLAFSTGMIGIFLAIFLAVVCCKTVCYQTSEDTAPKIFPGPEFYFHHDRVDANGNFSKPRYNYPCHCPSLTRWQNKSPVKKYT